jgi:hypothetical protein
MPHRPYSARRLLALAVVFHATGHAQETRYHEAIRRFENPPDRAEVVAAGFFGGAGHEWLAAAAFAPDGTIVLAGNVSGPGLAGATVLGRDGEPPRTPERKAELDDKGRPRLDKEGAPKLLPPSWTDEGVTGFIRIVSDDMRRTLAWRRLPWQAGALTSCVVGGDGAIYLAGKPGSAMESLASDVAVLAAAKPHEKAQGACDEVFVAKLTPDASEVLWLRRLRGSSNAPKLAWLPDGTLRLAAADFRNLDPDGREIGRLPIAATPGMLVDAHPSGRFFVRGGEHHSPTGREPWRCPVLNLHQPDGTQIEQFYDWLGPYVGLDSLRLVSDTAVRRAFFDASGDLWLYLWSDGGNSVALREPFDVRRGAAGFGGLGFSAWGAGVLSAAYILRIDSDSWRVRDGTLWLAYLDSVNKPNSAWIDQLALAADGSPCFTGRAANRVVTTGNRLSEAGSGQYVAILNGDLTSLRFSTTLPGTGIAQVGDTGETWNIASRVTGGRQRVIFVGSASEGEPETPVLNAAQTSFGGGWCDGYAVLLEMAAAPAAPPRAVPAGLDEDWRPVAADPTAKPVALPMTDGKGRGPQAGLKFGFARKKWATVDAEFRDTSGKLWPSFFYGHEASGDFTFDPARPELRAELTCDRVCQPAGDRKRRVLGELLPKEGQDIKLRFEVREIGAFKGRRDERQFNGRKQTREVMVAPADAVLHIGGRQLRVKAECVPSWQYAKGGKTPESALLDFTFQVRGGDLGLRGVPGLIDCQVGATAYGAAN